MDAADEAAPNRPGVVAVMDVFPSIPWMAAAVDVAPKKLEVVAADGVASLAAEGTWSAEEWTADELPHMVEVVMRGIGSHDTGRGGRSSGVSW